MQKIPTRHKLVKDFAFVIESRFAVGIMPELELICGTDQIAEHPLCVSPSAAYVSDAKPA